MAVKKKAVSERFIYLGPNLLKFGLQKYQVFIGGKPQAIDELSEKYPLIHQLIVRVEKLSEAEKAMNKKGTPIYMALQQIIGDEKDGI